MTSTATPKAKKAAPPKAAAAKKSPARPVLAGGEKLGVVKSTAAKLIAHEILTARGGEIQVKELARLVVETKRASLKGKTPEATVAAHIYVAAKKGELFRKTKRGHVELLPVPAASPAS